MTVIDRSAWPREGHYRFFEPMSNPIFALTFPVDVTALREYVKRKHLSFYMALVFLVTKAMEDTEAFRLRDRQGTIVRHDRLVPSFTDLKPDSDLFHIVTLEAGDELEDFAGGHGSFPPLPRVFSPRARASGTTTRKYISLACPGFPSPGR